MDSLPGDSLDVARKDAGLTSDDLFLRYFELGGMSSPLELEAICCGALRPSAHDHDVISHALNERFFELGRDRPLRYDADRGSDGP